MKFNYVVVLLAEVIAPYCANEKRAFNVDRK
jgi:hypothetical protein